MARYQLCIIIIIIIIIIKKLKTFLFTAVYHEFLQQRFLILISIYIIQCSTLYYFAVTLATGLCVSGTQKWLIIIIIIIIIIEAREKLGQAVAIGHILAKSPYLDHITWQQLGLMPMPEKGWNFDYTLYANWG